VSAETRGFDADGDADETLIGEGEISTADWQTYRNEEYGFEVKYPTDWYWEDYSEDFKHPMIGFYAPNSKKGWEFVGDIEIHKRNNENKESLEQYYESINKLMPDKEPDKVERKISQNGYEMIIEYDVLGNIISDIILIDCNTYFIEIVSPFNSTTDVMKTMADSLSNS
ncbi:hypothetical protein ACFL23_04945, partial [Patescibacteria group bacterium]